MPRPDGSVLLPIDMPPSKRQAHVAGGAANMAGIHTAAWAGEVQVDLYAVPWNPTESPTFPQYEGSRAAATIGQSSPFPVRQGRPNMNGLRPRTGVSINAYSPVSHRTPAALRDGVPPRAISARGVAVPTQRGRNYAAGYVTFWPQGAPVWPSYREAPGSRQG